MYFDRKLLDSLGFILPTERSSHRAQVPTTFILFAAAVGTVELPDGRKGKKFVITGAELIALFTVLRSNPPTHRWRGQDVEATMKRLGLGGNRVRAMLKYLFDEGWIRYIEILLPDGRNGGTITEVRYRRLSKTEARKKRKLRLGPGEEVRFFEEDGVTAVDGADYPRKFLIDDIDPARPYGKDSDPVEWEPYTRPSGTRESGIREPGMREPSERSPSKQYKEHLSEDHQIECTPSIPRSATGEPNSTILWEENQEVPEAACSGSRHTSSDADAPVTAAAASTPGPSFEQLTAELVKLGRDAARSPDDRVRYELFVKDRIVPHLDNPKAPDRWTAPAAKAWLGRSLKAHVLLALCSDDRWPESLLRSFGKRCGSYAKEDLWKVLLSFDWATKNRPTLSKLVQADTGRANLKGWASFKQPFFKKFAEERVETQCSLSYPVLSITAGRGFVSQADKFSRVIAGKQVEKYVLLKRGEFAYNKGNSYRYPQGCVYRLSEYDEGLVPNVFYSFKLRTKVADPEFIRQYFLAGLHNKDLHRWINSGVRNNGLLNLNASDFFKLPINLPPMDEQERIGKVLSDADEEIAALEQKLSALKQQKRSLMQKLLTGQVRVKV